MKRTWFIIGSAIVIIAIVLIIIYFIYFAEEGTSRTPMFSKKTEFKMDVAPADKKKISEIITTMGTTSTFGLAFEQGRLEKLGDEIHHVPPLEFQAVIFSDPQLAYYMRVIQESSMKYNNYVAGLQPGLVKEYQDGYLLDKTRGFARDLKLPEDQTVQIVKECSENAVKHKSKLAYKPFVDYLIEQKSPKSNPKKNGSMKNGDQMNGMQKEGEMKSQEDMQNHKEETPSTNDQMEKESADRPKEEASIQ